MLFATKLKILHYLQYFRRYVSTITVTFAEIPTVDVNTATIGERIATSLGIDFEEPAKDEKVFKISSTSEIYLEGVFLDAESYTAYAEAIKTAYFTSNPSM